MNINKLSIEEFKKEVNNYIDNHSAEEIINMLEKYKLDNVYKTGKIIYTTDISNNYNSIDYSESNIKSNEVISTKKSIYNVGKLKNYNRFDGYCEVA